MALTSSLKAPTQTVLRSGTSLTYNTPSGCKRLRIRMIGSGGGGQAGITGGGWGNVGANGTDTTFGGILTAKAGQGGNVAAGAGGTGGSVSLPASGFTIPGGGGGSGQAKAGGTDFASGPGGNGYFGGGGFGRVGGAGGGDAATNSGAGGGGGGLAIGSSGTVGAGGGSGEYLEAFIDNPLSSYVYTVGVGGVGGTGTTSGGRAGDGIIVIDEFY
jgi:hypothetical protein